MRRARAACQAARLGPVSRININCLNRARSCSCRLLLKCLSIRFVRSASYKLPCLKYITASRTQCYSPDSQITLRPWALRSFQLAPKATTSRVCCKGHDAAQNSPNPPGFPWGVFAARLRRPLHKPKAFVVASRCAENPLCACRQRACGPRLVADGSDFSITLCYIPHWEEE
jgi:hypothetical protein